MTAAIVPNQNSSLATSGQSVQQVAISGLEMALIKNDLSEMAPDERIKYYIRVCESLQLNPVTRPFNYIMFKGEGDREVLQLYPTKNCAEQLREQHGVSLGAPKITFLDDLVQVEIDATKGNRKDTDCGIVSLANKYGKLTGQNKANAIMKAISKAKRRVTFSICSMGFLNDISDEAEEVGFEVVDADLETVKELPKGKTIRTGDAAVITLKERNALWKEMQTQWGMSQDDAKAYFETLPSEYFMDGDRSFKQILCDHLQDVRRNIANWMSDKADQLPEQPDEEEEYREYFQGDLAPRPQPETFRGVSIE